MATSNSDTSITTPYSPADPEVRAMMRQIERGDPDGQQGPAPTAERYAAFHAWVVDAFGRPALTHYYNFPDPQWASEL